jgi:hypothetical protein
MRISKRAVAVAFVVVACAATLSAQGTNPNIFAAVQAVQTTLNSLVTTVNSLVTTVNRIDTAVTEGNVLFTPPGYTSSPNVLSCTATNVVAEQRSIKLQLFNPGTGELVVDGTLLPIAPGHSANVFAPAGPAGTVRAFCKITVVDGVKSDVRAVLSIFDMVNLGDKLLIAAH